MSNISLHFSPSRLKAVILGDVSLKNRHGSQRTMENLHAGLIENGIEVIASHPGRRWQSETWIAHAIRLADLLIINGSTKTQQGSPIIHDFLSAGEFSAQHRVPAFLINTAWHGNDSTLTKRATTFQRVYVQESVSQSILTEHGVSANMVPNLIFASNKNNINKMRSGLLASDAASQSLSKALQTLITSTKNGAFAPEVSSAWPAHRNQVPQQLQRHRRFQQTIGQLFGSLGLCPVRYLAQASALPTTDEYLDLLQSADAILSGRFHATCLAMLTRTPFLTVNEHTDITKAVLNDAGLSTDRILTNTQLRRSTLAQLRTSSFRKKELASLTSYLSEAEHFIAEMFSEMASLCRGEQPKWAAA